MIDVAVTGAGVGWIQNHKIHPPAGRYEAGSSNRGTPHSLEGKDVGEIIGVGKIGVKIRGRKSARSTEEKSHKYWWTLL